MTQSSIYCLLDQSKILPEVANNAPIKFVENLESTVVENYGSRHYELKHH